MSRLRIIDSPVSWAVAGFGIGLGLGVNGTSVWLLTAGLAAFIVYLRLHGSAQAGNEGRLFAAEPALIVAWLVGFIIHGIAF